MFISYIWTFIIMLLDFVTYELYLDKIGKSLQEAFGSESPSAETKQ